MAQTAEEQTPEIREELPEGFEAENDTPLEQLILNKAEGKYRVVELIAFLAKQLRGEEKYRHLNQTELLEYAMRKLLASEESELENLYKELLVAPSPNGKKDDKPSKKK
jgi:hypothetical protein